MIVLLLGNHFVTFAPDENNRANQDDDQSDGRKNHDGQKARVARSRFGRRDR